jgi:hypothetical protein
MNREEIQAIVGAPPGNYASRYVFRDGRSLWWWGDDAWVCEECELDVWYGPDGRAKQVQTMEVGHFPKPTLWERIRKSVGL